MKLIKKLYILILIMALCLNPFANALLQTTTVYASPDDDEDYDADDADEDDTTLEANNENHDSSLEDVKDNWPAGPNIKGKTAVVIDADTGAILYNKKMHKEMYPASITKILTCLLTLENCAMDEDVTMSHFAVYNLRYGDAHIGLKEGETISVESALYALMLASANEVAYGLSEKIGGSVEGFADMMNEKAKEVGAINSHFVNPNGLPDEDHYTTAYDMAMITRAAMQYDDFVKICGTRMYIIPETKMTNEKRYANNFHKMLEGKQYYNKEVLGGKTGYTEESGNTLVTFAERDGVRLICVVLNSKKIYPDTQKLFDYCFDKFDRVEIDVNAVTNINGMTYNKLAQSYGDGEIEIGFNNGTYLTLPKGADPKEVTYELSFTGKEFAPGDTVVAGESDPTAKLIYFYQGHEVGNIDIFYKVTGKKTEEKRGLFGIKKKAHMPKLINSSLIKAIKLIGLVALLIAIILGVIAARVAYVNYVNKKRKEARRRRRMQERERQMAQQEQEYLLEREYRTGRRKRDQDQE